MLDCLITHQQSATLEEPEMKTTWSSKEAKYLSLPLIGTMSGLFVLFVLLLVSSRVGAIQPSSARAPEPPGLIPPGTAAVATCGLAWRILPSDNVGPNYNNFLNSVAVVSEN